MKIVVYKKTGEKSDKKVDLPDSIFDAKINKVLMTQAIRVYLSNQRTSTASTRKRSAVSGGGKKPWGNNKVGKARTSTIRNPIWKGGGNVFGPTSDRNFKLGLTKKMRKASVLSSLSSMKNNIFLVEDLEVSKKRPTHVINKLVEKLTLEGKILFILAENNKVLVKAIKNIKGCDCILVTSMNTYQLLNTQNIILFEKTLDALKSLWKGVDTKETTKELNAVKVKKSSAKVEKKKVGKSGKGYLDSLDLTDSLKKKLDMEGIDNQKKLQDVLAGEIKVKGVGEKSLDTIKKFLK